MALGSCCGQPVGKPYLVGGFNPSEKYESQLGLLFPIYGQIKNVPNHQPDILFDIEIIEAC
jgi:hypothetical protein